MTSLYSNRIALQYVYYTSYDTSLPIEFVSAWDDLVDDQYQTNKKYPRQRRYCKFIFSRSEKSLHLQPHKPYYQSAEHNPLYGGIAREFAPISDTLINNQSIIQNLLSYNLEVLSLPYDTIEIDCHLVRIIAVQQGIGEPTPEGIHRDGFDYISIHLINRKNCIGGVTTVYSDKEEPIFNIELKHPLDSLILDDKLYKHGTTPIHSTGLVGTRDVLLCSYHNAQVG